MHFYRLQRLCFILNTIWRSNIFLSQNLALSGRWRQRGDILVHMGGWGHRRHSTDGIISTFSLKLQQGVGKNRCADPRVFWDPRIFLYYWSRVFHLFFIYYLLQCGQSTMVSLGFLKQGAVMLVGVAVLPREGRNRVSITCVLVNFPDADGWREPGCQHMDFFPHVKELGKWGTFSCFEILKRISRNLGSIFWVWKV